MILNKFTRHFSVPVEIRSFSINSLPVRREIQNFNAREFHLFVVRTIIFIPFARLIIDRFSTRVVRRTRRNKLPPLKFETRRASRVRTSRSDGRRSSSSPPILLASGSDFRPPIAPARPLVHPSPRASTILVRRIETSAFESFPPPFPRSAKRGSAANEFRQFRPLSCQVASAKRKIVARDRRRFERRRRSSRKRKNAVSDGATNGKAIAVRRRVATCFDPLDYSPC